MDQHVTAHRFTVHRANGWSVVVGVLGFLMIVETVGLHIALASWLSATAAWIATALSMSTLIWLIDDAAALSRGGVIVRAGEVELQIGRRYRGFILRALIDEVREGADDDATNLAVLGANIVLHLRQPVWIRGPLGRRIKARDLALSIDDRDGFVAALQPVRITRGTRGAPDPDRPRRP